MATAVFFISWLFGSIAFIRFTTSGADKTGRPEAALILCILLGWIPSAFLAAYLNDNLFKPLGW